jgi:hypothetical protein
MTDKIDTSTEAVEWVCRGIHDGITCREIPPVDGVGIQDFIRALAAERATLQARVTEARNEALEEAAQVADKYHAAAIKWAATHVESFNGNTDSARIAKDIRALKE